MTMCCAYLDKDEVVLKYFGNIACFGGLDVAIPKGATFFRFYFPLIGETTYEKNVASQASSISVNQREKFVALAGKLYDFEEYIQKIGPNELWAQFDLRKTSGFRIFAICTVLRYINEYPQIALLSLRLRKLALPEKEAFLFAHYFYGLDNHNFYMCQNIDPEDILKAVPKITYDEPFIKSPKFRPQKIWDVYSCGGNYSYLSSGKKVQFFSSLIKRVRKTPTSFMILLKLSQEFGLEGKFIKLCQQVKGFMSFARQQEKKLGA